MLKAFGQIIPLHTRMLKEGPSGSYQWKKEMMVNLGIIQLYLETLRRPFNELMVILTAERRESTILQIISRGVVLEVLRPPLDPSPRWWYQQLAHNPAMADQRSLSYR